MPRCRGSATGRRGGSRPSGTPTTAVPTSTTNMTGLRTMFLRVELPDGVDRRLAREFRVEDASGLGYVARSFFARCLLRLHLEPPRAHDHVQQIHEKRQGDQTKNQGS